MKLTLFSDYSLRILMFAALRDGQQFSVEEVSEVYGFSRHHAAKAVNFLTQRGYLRAQRGRGGGIALGRPAKEIRVGQLTRETEKSAPLVECFDAVRNTCPLTPACLLKQALAKASHAFYTALDEHTLADLVSNPSSLRRALALHP
jgi:Rrf2 family nitric oxide-sensitive transcriptional repressor